jgi:hypothetical protein
MKSKYTAGSVLLLFILLSSCSPRLVSSPTPTPKSTSTNTPRPTSTKPPATAAAPQSSTQLEIQEDGTWIFYDRDAGYQFELGENWHLEDVSALDLPGIFDRTSELPAELGIGLPPQYIIQPEGTRVLGVYLDETIPDYLSAAFGVAYIVDEGFASMPVEDIQSRVIETLANSYGLDPKTFETTLLKNDHDVEYGLFTFNLVLNFHQMRIIFKAEDGMGMAVFGFSDENMDALGADWGLFANSLQYINP